MARVPWRDWQKQIKATRIEAEKPVRIFVTGQEAEVKTFVEAFGEDGKAIFDWFSLPFIGKVSQLKAADLVILVLSGRDVQDGQVRDFLRLAPRKVLLLLNKVGLATQIAGKIKEAKTFYGLGEEQIETFLPLKDFHTQKRLLKKILHCCDGKELALAAKVPVFRLSVAEEIIKEVSQQNAFFGLVTIIPGSDMPVLTANQARMVLKIAAAFGVKLNLVRATELLAVLLGGFTFRALARQLLDFLPGPGWVIKGAVAYGGTRAIGQLAIRYFAGDEFSKQESEKGVSSKK